MSQNSFEEVSQLNTEELRHLLLAGSAVERVWAAWALGLRLGSGSISDLTIGLKDSPDAGTRRHILVVLAGFGEYEIIRVFAQNDPDAYVRATACKYLIQISQPNDTATQQFIRDCILTDSSSIVRLSILQHSTPAFLALNKDELGQMIEDNDLEVRKEVTNYLLATTSFDQLFPGVLESHIIHEPDKHLRQRLLALSLQANGETRLLSLAQNQSRELKMEVFVFLADSRSQCSWDSLKAYANSGEIRFDPLLLELLAPGNIINALPWLIQLIARAYDWPSPRNRLESQISYAVRTSAENAEQLLIASALQQHEVQNVSIGRKTLDAASKHIQNTIEQMKRQLEYGDFDEWEIDDEEYRQEIEERQQLIKFLKSINS